jgi:hypothetical protein
MPKMPDFASTFGTFGLTPRPRRCRPGCEDPKMPGTKPAPSAPSALAGVTRADGDSFRLRTVFRQRWLRCVRCTGATVEPYGGRCVSVKSSELMVTSGSLCRAFARTAGTGLRGTRGELLTLPGRLTWGQRGGPQHSAGRVRRTAEANGNEAREHPRHSPGDTRTLRTSVQLRPADAAELQSLALPLTR